MNILGNYFSLLFVLFIPYHFILSFFSLKGLPHSAHGIFPRQPGRKTSPLTKGTTVVSINRSHTGNVYCIQICGWIDGKMYRHCQNNSSAYLRVPEASGGAWNTKLDGVFKAAAALGHG